MIVCHPKELIFIKTKKVGGTSLEIALSQFCGPDCIITPFSEGDESTREMLGFRGPQNYLHSKAVALLTSRHRRFRNHSRADQVRRRLGRKTWEKYRKFTIVRDPYERALSRFFWDEKRGRTGGLNFGAYFEAHADVVTDNLRIAPVDGPNRLDIYLRFEHLEDDMKANDLGFLWDTFKDQTAKSGHRPREGSMASEIYARYPQVLSIIQEKCHAEIEKFGYVSPV